MDRDSGIHHSSVLTLALTFCGGLIAVHLAVGILAPHWLALTPGYKALVWRLQLVIAAATVLYLILRRGEGDFRALFIVVLGLFAIVEGLCVLARWHGFLALNELARPFNVALFIFSSLALSAAIADRTRQSQPPPAAAPCARHDPHHFALLLASIAFLFLSCLRGAIEMHQQELSERANVYTCAVLAVAALSVGAAILKGALRPAVEQAANPEAGGTPALPEAGGTPALPEAGGTPALPEAGGTPALPDAEETERQ
ncbi:MAG: hypothetical protein ABSE73_21250 [Planctomycetota bacterium]